MDPLPQRLKRLYLTSDNPCHWVETSYDLAMPVASDMFLVGRLKPKGGPPTFATLTPLSAKSATPTNSPLPVAPLACTPISIPKRPDSL